MAFPAWGYGFQADFGHCQYVWVEFGGLRAGRAVAEAGLGPEYPVYRSQSPDLGELVKEELVYLISHKDMAPHHLMGHLYLFLDALSRSALSPGRKEEERGLRGIYVGKAIRFIEKKFQNDISVEDIAGVCGLNRSYFGKLFKEAMGKTTQEFLLSYRMNRAAELLKQPQYSVGDIGCAVGYQNPLHFSRAFKNTYGISPREWRNRQRRSS
jgi:AraC-like DNA-binding protein